MNKLLLCIVCTAVMLMALCLNAAGAETVNPFQKVETDLTANAETETELRYESVDFAGGASLLRLQAETDSQLSIRIFADSTDSKPAASVVFKRVNKEMRCRLVLDGIHDLIIVIQGSGRLLSWQAFTAQEDIEAAIKAERGVNYEDRVPPKYTARRSDGGTVDKFTYTAHDYCRTGKAYEKTAFVYLPCGYDPAQTYDLLILCHGIGGSEHEWGLSSGSSQVKAIMDNLIAYGEIKPFIVVTPNGRAGKTDDYSSFYLFDQELRNDLLPALAASYSVDIKDRDRCAMAGLSMGGMQTINLGIGKCLDLFSAFGAFSAAPTSNTAPITAAVLNAHPDLPVRVFYSICGTGDTVALASATAAVKGLDSMTEQLNSRNFSVQTVPGGHDFGVWYLGFYNFARLFGAK